MPQRANIATNRYEFRQPHDPAGIGKFYMGREIAKVMGHEAADWLERAERDAEEHTEVLVEQLNLKPGDIVADMGAGKRKGCRAEGPIQREEALLIGRLSLPAGQ